MTEASRRAVLGFPLGLLGTSLLAAVEKNTPAAPKLDDWSKVRAQFQLAPGWMHFAGFYIASHPAPVRAAIDAFRRSLDENPFMTVEHGMFESDAENMELKVREAAAAYLGGRPDEIALTGSTTQGLALVYHGLQLGPGDEIVTTVHDHIVHHESIRLSTERNGATVRKISLFDEAANATADGIVARVHAGIGPKTRVLGVTWVHSATGIKLPIKQISAAVAEINRGREKPVLLVVDGVHGLGCSAESVAELGADFFCAGTHKWILGPRGTGLVWARAPQWALLKPLIPSFSEF